MGCWVNAHLHFMARLAPEGQSGPGSLAEGYPAVGKALEPAFRRGGGGGRLAFQDGGS